MSLKPKLKRLYIKVSWAAYLSVIVLSCLLLSYKQESALFIKLLPTLLAITVLPYYFFTTLMFRFTQKCFLLWKENSLKLGLLSVGVALLIMALTAFSSGLLVGVLQKLFSSEPTSILQSGLLYLAIGFVYSLPEGVVFGLYLARKIHKLEG